MGFGAAWARIRTGRPAGPAPTLRQFSCYLYRFATWVPVMMLVNSHVADLYFINGRSMVPTFNAEYNETLRRDWCLNLKFGAQDNIPRGTIVTFWSPIDPEKKAVKRVVGLEGDLVRTRQNTFVRVPQGHIWVEGDAGAGQSVDSNDYGPISARLVIGRITHILWPFHRLGRVPWWEYPERPGVLRRS